MNRVYAGLFCLMLSGIAYGQRVDDIYATNIDPFVLAISDIQTTNLIFPYGVKRAHCASKELDIEQMKDVKNILLVRSFVPSFSPTNLSVVTSDGQFYSFLLTYAAQASNLNIRFNAKGIDEPIAHVPLNAASLDTSATLVERQQKFIRQVRRNQQVKLSLDGIFMHNNLMWFAMNIRNSSLIDYSIDYLKVFIRDKKRSKKTIRQEKEINPVFVKMMNNVGGGQSAQVVMAFDPFTISMDKLLAIQLAEKNGGRSIEMRLPGNVFYKTRAILK